MFDRKYLTFGKRTALLDQIEWWSDFLAQRQRIWEFSGRLGISIKRVPNRRKSGRLAGAFSGLAQGKLLVTHCCINCVIYKGAVFTIRRPRSGFVSIIE